MSKANEIFEQVGDIDAEAHCAENLATAYQALGRYQESVEHRLRAVNLFHRAGNQVEHAESLEHLGDTYLLTGHRVDAEQVWAEMATVRQELGLPHPRNPSAAGRIQAVGPNAGDTVIS